MVISGEGGRGWGVGGGGGGLEGESMWGIQTCYVQIYIYIMPWFGTRVIWGFLLHIFSSHTRIQVHIRAHTHTHMHQNNPPQTEEKIPTDNTYIYT